MQAPDADAVAAGMVVVVIVTNMMKVVAIVKNTNTQQFRVDGRVVHGPLEIAEENGGRQATPFPALEG